MSILIKDTLIVTQNAERSIMRGDIFIDGSVIAAVGKDIREKAEWVIDGRGKIAIPGLVNGHTHSAMSLFRGYGEDMQLEEWLKRRIWPAEAKLTGEDVYWGAMLGIAEMIRGGTTCFNEMYITGMEELAKAVEDSGIRAMISWGMFDLVSRRRPDEELKIREPFNRKWSRGHERIKVAVACHAPYTCSEELLVKAKEYANGHGMRYHIHVSETRKEVFDILKSKAKRPVEWLDSLGVIDERTDLAHAAWVTKREIALVGRKRAAVCHCPTSSLKLATGGICPITEYAAAGTTVMLGTDSAASNNSLNVFEAMKMAALLQRHHYWKADVIKSQEIFDMATRNGAAVLGFGAGSIEKGRIADIVLLDAKAPNMRPLHDSVANIVFAAGPQNVSYVIINGKVVMEEGKIITFEEEKVVEMASRRAAIIHSNLTIDK